MASNYLLGSGIGKACAHAYSVEGAAGVVFADIDKAAAEKAALASRALATNEKYRFLVVRVDVTDEHSVEEMIATMVLEFGRIDYAVNCAGVSIPNFLWIDDYVCTTPIGLMSVYRLVRKIPQELEKALSRSSKIFLM